MVLPEEPTVPTPWLIDTEVAFETFQLKLLEPPTVMLDGLAMKELITGKPVGVAPETITCVVAVTLPAELDAVRV